MNKQEERKPKYRYSEIFGHTIQGEGKYSPSRGTVWIRFWGCNFKCDGFGQKNIDDKSSWVLPYKDIDPSKYEKLEDLPVFEYGCDSSYSWSKEFSCLAKRGTSDEIVDEIEKLLPEGKFQHFKTKQWHHMAFTGGEPIISQNAIVSIMDEFKSRNNLPKFVTIETNGTQSIRQPFIDMVNRYFKVDEPYDRLKEYPELFWSVSPKLFLSGEKWEDAIKPEIVKSYYDVSPFGQLKFVCDGSDRAWNEIERATQLYRDAGVDWDVYIMPVGATKEEQEEIQAKVIVEAIDRGYYASPRVHSLLFGNTIGT